MQEKLNQQQQARDLYFGAEHTQKQIADKVGVSERTVYGWIKHNSWAQLREAAFAAPAIINQNISNHIIALQNVISARPIEERYPTKDESQIISRMLLCMDRLKKFPSLGQNLHMMQNFINTFVGRDMDTAEKVTTYADQYFRSKTQNGFDAWQMEYQMEEKQYQTFTKNEAAKEEMACHGEPRRTTQNTDNEGAYTPNPTGTKPACPPWQEVSCNFPEESTPSVAEACGEGGRNFSHRDSGHQSPSPLGEDRDEAPLATGNEPEVSRNFQTPESSLSLNPENPDSDNFATGNEPEISRNFSHRDSGHRSPSPLGEGGDEARLATGTKPACPPWREVSRNSVVIVSSVEPPPTRLDSDILTEEIRYTNGIPWKYCLRNGKVDDIAYAYDGQDMELHLLQLHLERDGHYGIDESSDPANPIVNSLCGVEGGRYRKCKTQNGEIVELGDFIPDEIIKAIDSRSKQIWLSQQKRA